MQLQRSVFAVFRVPAVKALFGSFAPAHCRSHLPPKQKRSEDVVKGLRSERKNIRFVSSKHRSSGGEPAVSERTTFGFSGINSMPPQQLMLDFFSFPTDLHIHRRSLARETCESSVHQVKFHEVGCRGRTNRVRWTGAPQSTKRPSQTCYYEEVSPYLSLAEENSTPHRDDNQTEGNTGTCRLYEQTK